MRNPLFSWLFLISICSIFPSFCIFVVSGQCLGSQKSLLLQLKNNLTFYPLTFNPAMSKKLAQWNQSHDCCFWEGVNCAEGHVIGLDLSNEAISGGLDNLSSLFNLQNLENLSLAYNYFNGSQIPSKFDKLVNLRYLNLSNAGFGGQIPIAISHLPRLVSLDLSAVYFPEFTRLKLENPNLNMLVQNLPELIELNLDGVKIAAQGNEWCHALSSSLPNLRVLSLSNSDLSGPINSTLLKLQSLSIIRLDNNNLSSPVPEFFANFAKLTSLRLSSSGLIGTFPENIFQVPTLEILDLSNNVHLNGVLPDFPQNGSLRTLVLSNTNFSGTLSDTMGNLTKLSKIDLSNCSFRGSMPHSMAKLTQLLYLDMSSNNFIGPIPSFSMAKNLTQINLSRNDLIGHITSTRWEELRYLVSLDLRYNSLNGSIPASLFSLPSLQKLQLSNNQFSGELNQSSHASSDLLDTLDLSSNNLIGRIPMSVFELRALRILSLSSNKFNGSLQLLNVIQQLRNLSNLDLSYNMLWIEHDGTDGINSSLSSFPQITTLKLASSKLKKFPVFLRNLSELTYLDLSDNQIDGDVPNWLWELHKLVGLNLSFNSLVTLEGPLYNLYFLSVLDLSSNKLQGQLPVLPPYATYLDFSRNDFSSVIPASIGDSLNFAFFFSLSSNKFKGSIPVSICNATYLQVLDLSNNFFSGKIPQCLIEMSGTLGVLNLRRNELNGPIPDFFTSNCGLHTLNLNGNKIEGQLPKSLANCMKLEVVDIGNNLVKGNFPCYLKNTSMLRVLVLRSNKFDGPIGCSEPNATWPMLQIVDVASNNFTGNLPKVLAWKAMMVDENEAQSELKNLQFEVLSFNRFYYQDATTVTFKGLQLELVKILTVFTSIDFSCNNLEGPIPEEFRVLKSLYALNLSHNALTGQIPPSLANLIRLESLDLSRNKLTGEIPVELADGLHFLSFLDLSFNQLVGQIPQIKQFATFSEASYAGNKELCGSPLKVECDGNESNNQSPPAPASFRTFEVSHSNTRIVIDWNKIDWNYISPELGFIFGFGIVIAPLMFLKRWRIWYSKQIDNILFKIFPQLYLHKEYRRRRKHRN
ncbi:receptor-like protein 6 [Alnus glutinosa]|uniref:receptor-like protein 6 n=1 Tax=Alnus glutinosa TaxID=3517 RepID=UPI002D79F3BD|nr:receptor-like protein 6 [Alnus glutinosa]